MAASYHGVVAEAGFPLSKKNSFLHDDLVPNFQREENSIH
jgi:hypothetical protein